jgi:hypothetical protein
MSSEKGMIHAEAGPWGSANTDGTNERCRSLQCFVESRALVMYSTDVDNSRGASWQVLQGGYVNGVNRGAANELDV